jgi:hypothetical protein
MAKVRLYEVTADGSVTGRAIELEDDCPLFTSDQFAKALDKKAAAIGTALFEQLKTIIEDTQ